MINFIDGLHLGRAQVIGVGVVGTEQLALIDSGPECCFDATVAGIRRLGLRPENVTHLLVTHIHLDHSGGAWRWAREFGTTICVHPRGAPHIENPEKLVASATKIFGTDKIGITATCVRVPVLRAHCESINVTLRWVGWERQTEDGACVF